MKRKLRLLQVSLIFALLLQVYLVYATTTYVKQFTATARSCANNFSQSPNAIYHNGKTYLVYQANPSLDPYAIVFTHSTRKFGTPVKVGTNPLVDDNHGSPSLIIDAGGYLHVFFGCHGTPMKHAKSNNPYDISSWTMQDDVTSDSAYPRPFQNESNIWVFYRADAGLYAYRKSTDNGSTWGAETIFTDTDGYYLGVPTWYDNKIYWSGSWDGPVTGGKRYNMHCFYFNAVDNKFYNVSGTDFDTVISLAEMNNSKVEDSGIYESNDGSVSVNPVTGYPMLMYPMQEVTGWEIHFAKWSGTEWSVTNVTKTDNQFNRGVMNVTSATEIKAYITVSGLTGRGGDIEEWDCNATGWFKNSTIMTESSSGQPLGHPHIPLNSKPELKLTFCQVLNYDFEIDLKGYAYGSFVVEEEEPEEPEPEPEPFDISSIMPLIELVVILSVLGMLMNMLDKMEKSLGK